MFLIRHSSEFAESTILTIAHRLRTVIDYNRVSHRVIVNQSLSNIDDSG